MLLEVRVELLRDLGMLQQQRSTWLEMRFHNRCLELTLNIQRDTRLLKWLVGLQTEEQSRKHPSQIW